jgi:hypothetical protein
MIIIKKNNMFVQVKEKTNVTTIKKKNGSNTENDNKETLKNPEPRK